MSVTNSTNNTGMCPKVEQPKQQDMPNNENLGPSFVSKKADQEFYDRYHHRTFFGNPETTQVSTYVNNQNSVGNVEHVGNLVIREGQSVVIRRGGSLRISSNRSQSTCPVEQSSNGAVAEDTRRVAEDPRRLVEDPNGCKYVVVGEDSI